MVPSSVTKMKMARLPGASRKSVALPLNITPVGEPGAVWLGALGTVTTNGTIAPAPLYKVEVPPALLEIHQGLPGLETNPQAFCRLGSVTAARPGMFETRFVVV